MANSMRRMFALAVGLAVLGMATNMVVFLSGRPGNLVPALIEVGNTVLPPDAASPLPQALVLTAIVIGFALLCFALVLAATIARQQGHTNLAAYRDSEPSGSPESENEKPSVMEAD